MLRGVSVTMCLLTIVFKTVADAMQHVHMQAAHLRNVVNRDVRQPNLMYTQSTIYLVDWGSATLLHSALYEGTVHYASERACNGWHKGLVGLKLALQMIWSHLWPVSSVLVIQMCTKTCRG